MGMLALAGLAQLVTLRASRTVSTILSQVCDTLVARLCYWALEGVLVTFPRTKAQTVMEDGAPEVVIVEGGGVGVGGRERFPITWLLHAPHPLGRFPGMWYASGSASSSVRMSSFSSFPKRARLKALCKVVLGVGRLSKRTTDGPSTRQRAHEESDGKARGYGRGKSKGVEEGIFCIPYAFVVSYRLSQIVRTTGFRIVVEWRWSAAVPNASSQTMGPPS
ncbi:unnamed protein product [Trypanosoma congolense IL3000]|uniref:WGS project CAEQ00000000 data, annotated contig 2161 n=1 Tax=Trypanosoma congolense (strain IL3000) TaxID=1068625 RepID=F9WBY1_TRYCI|nr:unnamed protein product [Trypanosoma congolense IL3000]